MTSEKVMALERPDPALWHYYIVRAILSGPGFLVAFPYLYFRYHTLRYRFDTEGIHMRVGILFRREVNLTYSRIQDIHLKSGLIQRWFGLADLEVQTASGSMSAELVIEGFKEAEAIRDFLYSRMRGVHAPAAPKAATPGQEDVVGLLLAIRDELKRTRECLESKNRAAPPSSGA